MTHHLNSFARPGATRATHSTATRDLAEAASVEVTALRASTSLAVSLTVALRYLEGRVDRSPAPRAVTGLTHS